MAGNTQLMLMFLPSCLVKCAQSLGQLVLQDLESRGRRPISQRCLCSAACIKASAAYRSSLPDLCDAWKACSRAGSSSSLNLIALRQDVLFTVFSLAFAHLRTTKRSRDGVKADA